MYHLPMSSNPKDELQSSQQSTSFGSLWISILTNNGVLLRDQYLLTAINEATNTMKKKSSFDDQISSASVSLLIRDTSFLNVYHLAFSRFCPMVL